MYDPHTNFGKDSRPMTIGGKYKWKANENPPPGYYETDRGIQHVKSRSIATKIVKNGYVKRRVDTAPDAGMYDPYTQFGS